MPLLRAHLDTSHFDSACLLLLEYVDYLDRECRSLGDVSGLLPWQLMSRVVAGLTATTDIDRIKYLKKYVSRFDTVLALCVYRAI